MSERRVDRVTVLLHRGGTIAIPWESQQALLAEMRPDSMRATRKAFKDCGTSVSVNLTPEQMGDVITVIEFMAKDAARGDDDLAAGLFELRNALRDDVEHHRP